jgi:hypothetical protein
VQLIKAIVRGFSYVYHAVLALFLAAVAGLALATAPQSLHLDMLPWTGSTLAYVVFFGSLFGLATVVLAVLRTLRPLFFLWSLAVVVLMTRGFFFSGFRFDPGAGGVKTAAYLVVGSLLALLGAWWQMMSTNASRRRY